MNEFESTMNNYDSGNAVYSEVVAADVMKFLIVAATVKLL